MVDMEQQVLVLMAVLVEQLHFLVNPPHLEEFHSLLEVVQ
tara:strand:+ start:85 stop:204 length:120 start_codon:yes stop_codon:yes gene_type:complete